MVAVCACRRSSTSRSPTFTGDCHHALGLDAALYDPASPRVPGTIGRPRKKGARLPTLSEVLTTESTLWQTVSVPSWYGAGERTIEIASATAVWRHAGLPVLPIRWVLIRDPEGRLAPQALLWLTSTEVVEISV